MPLCCAARTARDSALSRAPLRGPSGIVTTSTPRAWSNRTAAIASEGSCPRGGGTSTRVTKQPSLRRRASPDFSARATGGWAFG